MNANVTTSHPDDNGAEDAAILLMSLGEEEAAEVFKHLAPKDVQKLGETIARMKAVPRERVDRVLERFGTMAGEQSMLVPDTDEYVKAVLRKALGDEKANLLIDRILQGSDVTGIESLKWMDPASVAELLRNEHPQIVAAILVHLDFDQASAVLKAFPERQRNEVLVRIATLDGIQPSALNDLNEVLSRVLAGGERPRKIVAGRREDRRRDHQPAGRQRRDRGARLRARGRQRSGAEDHGQHVHLRRPGEARRQGHPGAAEGSAVRVAGHRAQGRDARAAREDLQATCRRAPPRRCAKTSSRADRCACPRSRPSRRNCSRSCAAWPTKARSSLGGGGDDEFV